MVLKAMILPGITRGEQARREEDEGLNPRETPVLRGGGEKEEQVKEPKKEEAMKQKESQVFWKVRKFFKCLKEEGGNQLCCMMLLNQVM